MGNIPPGRLEGGVFKPDPGFSPEMMLNKDLKRNPIFAEGEWPDKHIIEDYPEQRNPEPEEERLHQEEAAGDIKTNYTKEVLMSGRDCVQVCFICDCTASMGSYIQRAKETIFRMIVDLKDMNPRAVIEIGFVAYLDHCDNWITDTMKFTTSEQNINRFVDELSAQGGGDYPEAVADGLYAARHMLWKPDAAKILIHILDAPPHGTKYCNSNGDSYPSGCPCGYDCNQLLKEMYEMNIQYNILNCTDQLDYMVSVFKTAHPDLYDVPLGKGKGNATAAADMGDVVSKQTQVIMQEKFGWVSTPTT